jgi:hypothetical protein
MAAALAFPVLWVGPAGSGKLTAARAAIGVPPDKVPRLQTLEIGDYSARYWEFPTHMEVDVMDLSMMDKQILPEILTQLLSTRSVMGGGRKLMILRRIHGLSPAAAVRLRACLESLVWAPNAPAMIWCTARTVSSVVAGVLDGFVYRRVPGVAEMSEQPSRMALAKRLGAGVPAAAVPTIQTYIAEMMRQMAIALEEGPPTLEAAEWIRGCIYDLLGLMITGADLVSGLVWATVRLAAVGALDTARAKRVLGVLARARWVPSYRTPLILEMIVASVYNALAPSTPPVLSAAD